MFLKAPCLYPMEGPPIKDHALRIENGRIAEILPWKLAPSRGIIDLPQTAILPGLVNAHAHLELSGFGQPLTYPGSFGGWVRILIAAKSKLSSQDYEDGFRRGISQVLETGTTTVADHVSAAVDPWLLASSPLSGIIYVEVLGVSRSRAESTIALARKTEQKYRGHRRFRTIPTPHSTYSLLPSFFASLMGNDGPLSVHIAESEEEVHLFKDKTGPLFQLIEELGFELPTSGDSPLGYLKHLGLLKEGMLAIHANYLSPPDLATLAAFQMSVIHCPGSLTYFHHEPFSLQLLLEDGVNVALGTDSLASNSDLSMLRQICLLLTRFQWLRPDQAFSMATLKGAKALQLDHEVGSIRVGKKANLIGFPLPLQQSSPLEEVLAVDKPSFVMIEGKVHHGL